MVSERVELDGWSVSGASEMASERVYEMVAIVSCGE